MRCWQRRTACTALVLGALLASGARAASQDMPRLAGFNVIQSPSHPFGSPSAQRSLANAKRIGANAIAVVPFLWQAAPASPDPVRGKDMTDDELRAAIRDAHALGLSVMVKPQIWVPQSWAGAVAMNFEQNWAVWFANYGAEIGRLARVAAEEKAEAFAVGTELAATSQWPEWNKLIDTVRKAYSGRLLYMAHNVEEAEKAPFWNRLDAIGVTLYPPLGTDEDRIGRLARMVETAQRLDALAARLDKPVIVGEIGLRSARGAAAKPWESAEERVSATDPNLQAEALADWLSILDRPSVRGVLIWRWLTDPDAGGINDTDFTVQGKPAERILRCAWIAQCAPGPMRARLP
jgi:sugar phosphate isomerase/epimerase